MVEVATEQVPFPVDVKVSEILPAEISAALGVYVAVVKEVAFANVPVPFEVQAMPVLFVALEPAVILTAPVLEHVAIAVPATAVDAGVMMKLLVEVATAHVPFPVDVKVNVVLPTAISAPLGV